MFPPSNNVVLVSIDFVALMSSFVSNERLLTWTAPGYGDKRHALVPFSASVAVKRRFSPPLPLASACFVGLSTTFVSNGSHSTQFGTDHPVNQHALVQIATTVAPEDRFLHINCSSRGCFPYFGPNPCQTVAERHELLPIICEVNTYLCQSRFPWRSSGIFPSLYLSRGRISRRCRPNSC